jgi:hypothetical protein
MGLAKAIVASFADVCDAINSWQAPPQDLFALFREILHTFKGAMAPQQWYSFCFSVLFRLAVLVIDCFVSQLCRQAYFGSFPAELATSLSARYGI